MQPIAESTQSSDVFFLKEILGLLETTEKCIVPEKRQEFRCQVKSDLAKLNVALVSTLSKVTDAYTDEESADFDEEWRQLRTRIETLKRGIQLLSPRTQEDFEATLRWMKVQGVEADLELLHRVKKTPPYSSKNIEQLLKIAIQGIQKRIVEEFFDFNSEAFNGLTGGEGGVSTEHLIEIKESLQSLFEQEEIDRWLHTPNARFDGKTPVEAIVEGQADRILHLLIRLEEGAHY